MLDQPGDSTFTFSSEAGDEATFTMDTELGAVWGSAELADGRDFIIEPNLENCNGCHVVIEEDRAAFHNDHKASPPPSAFAEVRLNSAWAANVGALLKKGKSDKDTLVTYTIKVYYTPEVKKSIKNIKTMVDQVVAMTN